jgi:glycosyltransferase involved in cell wall biosynthesis
VSVRGQLSDRLRIAWASPVNSGSAIGRVSADVTDALIARGHDVRLIATEADPALAAASRHPATAECEHFSAVDFDRLAEETDAVVVNIGDNYAFHAGVFPLLERGGCVGVFHDFYLYNLLRGWSEAIAGGRPASWARARRIQVVTDTYGAPLAGLAARAETGEASLDAIAARMPMTEWLAAKCAGALGHAGFYLDRLAAGCPGPIEMARLPVRGREVAPLAPREAAGLRLLTVGVMNANKCAAEVIEAIAGAPALRDRIGYDLAGPIDETERARLGALASRLDYRGLAIHGPVDDGRLKALLEAADVICCLRRPVLEGASGSTVEALMAARPVLVANAGSAAEIPDDMVFKIPAACAPADIAAQLQRLADDPVLRRTAGAKGKAWAVETFSLTAYVDTLEGLIRAAIAAWPAQAVGRALGREIAALGLGPGDPAVARVEAVLAPLLSGARR